MEIPFVFILEYVGIDGFEAFKKKKRYAMNILGYSKNKAEDFASSVVELGLGQGSKILRSLPF